MNQVRAKKAGGRKRSRMMARTTFWVAAMALALPALSQSAVGGPSSEFVLPGSSALAPASASGVLREQEVFREIDDPHSGERWLLLRDLNHPGGPGRLVLAAQQTAASSRETKDNLLPSKSLLVIRAGDALIVEEHTAVLDARLEGTAINSAAKGAQLKVRLRIGGKVVRAVALAPGRALLAPDRETSQ
jgi:hypothetical protein